MSDYDLPSVYTETYRRAAKPHRCCECYREIPKGQLYQHVKGCWEGEWLEFKTCERCDGQRHYLSRQIGESAPFGELREWCFESDIKFWAEEEAG